MSEPLPYRIAVLCYLFDAADRLLLLHRCKPPNQHLYSPVGGKLDQSIGESPTQCAQREIQEETGLNVPVDRLHLAGMISESGYQGQAHWLMFLFEVIGPVELEPHSFDEGRLEWHHQDALAQLPIPQTDREAIWPLFFEHRGKFFAAHIDCTKDPLDTRLEQLIG